MTVATGSADVTSSVTVVPDRVLTKICIRKVEPTVAKRSVPSVIVDALPDDCARTPAVPQPWGTRCSKSTGPPWSVPSVILDQPTEIPQP